MFTELEGFFVPDADDEARHMTLRGVSLRGWLREEILDREKRRVDAGTLDIYVLNGEGDVIGEYALASAVVEADAALLDAGELRLVAAPMNPPHPEAGEVWKLWQQRQPNERGQWVPLSRSRREAWLEAVRLHHSRFYGRYRDKPPNETYTLNGRNITDGTSFYLAIGEAINGPGGYFGAGADGLNDCLAGDFGAETPFTLEWPDADVARAGMGRLPSGIDHFQKVNEILTESGVTVLLR
ncbi:barstar family protein [Actinomadura syzygii]|uniref:barstar family protein n=1 Tax=Actinomadura syzygii TaxID=1427538 RepID=UPI001CA37F69|nr:barstar family protein [Actinomadura syzygii]